MEEGGMGGEEGGRGGRRRLETAGFNCRPIEKYTSETK